MLLRNERVQFGSRLSFEQASGSYSRCHYTTGTSKTVDHCSSATTITKLVGVLPFSASAIAIARPRRAAAVAAS